jgi:hypothetical protein
MKLELVARILSMGKIFALILISLYLMVGCSGGPQSGAVYRGNLKNTGVYQTEALTDSVSVAWT